VSELRFGIAGAGMIATVHRDALDALDAVRLTGIMGAAAAAPDRGRAP